MNKDILGKPAVVEETAKKTGLSKATSAKALDAIIGVVSDAMADGKKVRLIGFGTFLARKRAARKGRNPQTGKPMEISARMSPAFKAGRSLKQAVNK